jgi:predicted enzyme related to lactoylglutathione lyase
MPRIVHFEIHAENPDRAATFYTSLLGWQFQKWEGPMPYWLIVTGPDGTPGINGGLLPRECAAPADGQAVNSYVCTVDTENLDALLAQVPALGGTITVPKMEIPGVGWLAYFKDTEGNILGAMQPAPGAKC